MSDRRFAGLVPLALADRVRPSPPSHELIMRALSLIFSIGLMLVSGCADNNVTDPAVASEGPQLSPGQSTAAERWMALTRTIVGRREFGSPLGTSRTFALVAVAQYNAAVAAGTAPKVGGKQPSEAAAVSRASARVLGVLYPVEVDVIAAQLASDTEYFATFPSQQGADYSAGGSIGESNGSAVLARGAVDLTNLVWTGTVPTGAGRWVNSPPPAQPVAPRWGEARGWLLSSGDQFRPAPPPVYNSAEFLTALAEVKNATVARTPAQLAIAQFWQGGSGPGGVMGHLTEVVAGLTKAAMMNERRTARVYAQMHMAFMDATIGCWDAKYAYWYIRPHQADPTITTPVGRPNFPAYPSAHSCSTAAGATVVAGLFSAAKPEMDAMIAEAGVARIYAGLHYLFDITAGQELGVKVGALALAKSPAPNRQISLQ